MTGDSNTPLDMPPPGEDMLQFYMKRAYARTEPAPPAELTPVQGLDFDEKLRLERAIAKSDKQMHDAQTQLDRPSLAPFELTPLEQAEEDSAKAKQYNRSLNDKIHNHKLRNSTHLCEEVVIIIGELEPKKLVFHSRLPVRAKSVSSTTLRPSLIPKLADLGACSPAYERSKSFFTTLDKSHK